MIRRAPESNPFEFVRVASLRAAQLMRGCTPRVPVGRRAVITAQVEVIAGKVQASPRLAAPAATAPIRQELSPLLAR
jgi:hypothetical protein